MERNQFNLAQYVSEKSKNNLILRLKELEAEELKEKPYKTIPIIHNGELKKHIIYADAEIFKDANRTIGNAFVKLFSKKTNEQKRARETIINYSCDRLYEIRQKGFTALLESVKVQSDLLTSSNGIFIDDGYSFEEAN